MATRRSSAAAVASPRYSPWLYALAGGAVVGAGAWWWAARAKTPAATLPQGGGAAPTRPVDPNQPPPGAPANPAPSGPVPGSAADAMLRAQRVLAAINFYAGPLDGALTPATADALRRFQEGKGLAVTGTLTDETDAILRAIPVA